MIPFEECNLKERIKDLFKLTKYNGIFEIEFMKGPDGKDYFLEINLRAMKEEDFVVTEKFLQIHRDEMLGFDELNLNKLKGKSLMSRLLSWG